jgi:hypothetical protein
MATPPLSELEQRHKWLVDHIPYRIRAVLTGLPIDPPWHVPLVAQWMQAERLANDCAWAAVHEGRLSAMRWLIEFIGIKESKGRAVPSKNERRTDTFIDSFPGGILHPLDGADAKKLADLWKGCSQAGGHATHGTEHPDTSDTRLAEALTIILGHLERTIYAEHKINLFDAVRGK